MFILTFVGVTPIIDQVQDVRTANLMVIPLYHEELAPWDEHAAIHSSILDEDPAESGEFAVILIQKTVQSTFLSVPLIQQNPELPRGCEVTSLAMLLQYAGVQVDKMILAEQINKVPFFMEGWNGNMHEGFVGDIYSFNNPGLGVYVEPVLSLGSEYLPDSLLNLTGSDITDLLQMIDQGSPVWVILNMNFELLSEQDFLTWYTNDGEMNVTYLEHSVVITGYDDMYIYVNDPLDDMPDKPVSRVDFEEAWIQMGSQAIGIDPIYLQSEFDIRTI